MPVASAPCRSPRPEPVHASLTRPGTRRRTTACGCTGRSTAAASRRSCSCRRPRSATPASGRRRCTTSPATIASSSMTAAGTGDPTRLTRRGTWLAGWYASDCLAVMDATATEAAVLAGICNDGVWPSVQIAAAHPERVLGLVALAPGLPLLVPGHPWRVAAQDELRRGARRAGGLGEGEPPLHPRRPARLPRVLLRRDVPGAALDEADRGRRRVRARRSGRAPGDGRGAARREPRGGRGDLPSRALPGARRPGRPRQLPAVRARPRVRRADRRRARPARRLGPHPQRAQSRWSSTG